MTYSVLIIGATGNIGSKISKELAAHKSELKRTAFLTAVADAGPEKEAKYAAIDLERVVGGLSDPASYKGFDIVISAVGDDLCAQQAEFADAAFAAGVKHFYPTEYGADLSHAKSVPEAYFVNKIATRKYLEERVKADPSLGYTYILVGLFTDVFLWFNVLGLSQDRRSAVFIGTPDAKISTTFSDDVANVVVTSLLPSHLPSLSGGRTVKFSGTTLTAAELFSTVEKVSGHPIAVKYLTEEESYGFAKAQKDAGNAFLSKFVSAMRSIGFGGAEMIDDDNKQYQDIVSTNWEDAVKAWWAVVGK